MTPTARRIPRAGDLSVVCNEEFEPLRTELPVLSDTPAEIASTRGLDRLQPLLRAVVLATAFSAGLLFKQFNKRLTGPNDEVAAAAPGGHRPAVITGHVHMAKTAGTTLNAMMALRYSNVCGDKGYSLDFYAENERRRRNGPKNDKEFDRSRVRETFLNEIGFEECDWISNEPQQQWRWWNNTFPNGKLHGVPVELHVPCREPVDHLMSMCNHHHDIFTCDHGSDEDIRKAVARCKAVRFLDRYNNKLRESFRVRCFDHRNFTSYVEHMSTSLMERRFADSEYVRWKTNTDRNRTDECIWKNESLRERVEEHLLEKAYYKFCGECMGSEDEIQL